MPVLSFTWTIILTHATENNMIQVKVSKTNHTVEVKAI